jgi:hypothetical protein
MTMKVNFFNRKPIQLAIGAALVACSLLVSCDKGDDDVQDQTYAVSGNSSGSQVNPSNTSTATGTMTGSFNARTNLLSYTINWSSLTATAGLVQMYGGAMAGANGTLLFPLAITTPGVTGSASGSITLNDAQETDLLAGKTYYTVSSSTYPSGEIRGQIVAAAN